MRDTGRALGGDVFRREHGDYFAELLHFQLRLYFFNSLFIVIKYP